MSPNRFGGFVLDDTPESQEIADYLAWAKGNSVNISDVLRKYLLSLSRGETPIDPAMQAILERLDNIEGQLDDIRRDVKRISVSGVAVSTTSREMLPDERREETRRKLASMDD